MIIVITDIQLPPSLSSKAREIGVGGTLDTTRVGDNTSDRWALGYVHMYLERDEYIMAL